MSATQAKPAPHPAPTAAPPPVLAPADVGATAPGVGALSWRTVWQLPALAIAGALLVAGLFATRGGEGGHDFSGALDHAQKTLESGDSAGAIERLNQTILPHLASPEATIEVRGRFYALRADALYEKQRTLPGPDPEHFRTILSNYEQAKNLLYTLSPMQRARVADCLVATGHFDEAADEIRAIPDDQAQRRHRLLRKTIEGRLASEHVDLDKALGLLAELSSDPQLSPRDHAWAIARQAELRIEAGRPEEALGRLLRALNRVEGVDPHDRAELYVLLAWAYFDLGRLDDARRHVVIAEEMLEPHDSLRSECLFLAGRILQTNGDLQGARERYTEAIETFPEATAAAAAALGRAEINAALGEWDESIRDYRSAIQRLPVGRQRYRVNPETIGRSISIWWNDRREQGDYERSIDFVTLAAAAFPPADLPVEVPLALAEARLALGERSLAAGAGAGAPGGVRAVSDLDPAARVEARAHFEAAGEQFLAHARRVILSDPDLFRDSLWRAGDAFDRAGDTDRAIEVFSEYAAGEATDPRRSSAVFRLAQAHQARAEFDLAATLYRDLINAAGASPEAGSARVRLAQCFIRNASPEDDPEAESLLRAAIESGVFKPEAEEFRLALFELAAIYYEQRVLPEAIRRLEEAVVRYPSDPGINVLRYKLADAHRLTAIAIDAELGTAMPDQERAALEALREERLREGLALYEAVRSDLDSRDPRTLTALDLRILRNSDFYRADCAYDLKEFDTAIRWYDAAAQRYADDPSSLVAMMQIVNAYAAQGLWSEAATAQERARQRLAELPEDAFASPDLPIEQRHWERWAEVAPRLSHAENAPADRDP